MNSNDILNIQSMLDCLENTILCKTGHKLDAPFNIIEIQSGQGKYSHSLCACVSDQETGDTIGVNLCIGRNSENRVIYNFKHWDTIFTRISGSRNLLREVLKTEFKNWWLNTKFVLLSPEYKFKQVEKFKMELLMTATANQQWHNLQE